MFVDLRWGQGWGKLPGLDETRRDSVGVCSISCAAARTSSILVESQTVLLGHDCSQTEVTLLIWRILYRVPRVRIPPSPPKSCLWRFSAGTIEIARTAGFIRIFSSIAERHLPVICEQDAADFSVSG